MNYRHAFHAGNFADVMKHALLARILAYLHKKTAPIRAIDTHAGIGLYDLAGDEASRTAEWQGGIGLMEAPFGPEIEALLAPWRQAVRLVRERHGAMAYPGSPGILREILRREDRAVLVEMHPADHATLLGRMATAKNIKVLHLDGWVALGSLIPPRERRGLVLIDPPFEEKGELERCAAKLSAAVAKWPTGVFMLWYPIKSMPEIGSFAARLKDTLGASTLRLELLIDRVDGTRLAGSGLIVVNPPWTLAEDCRTLLPALAQRLGRSPDAAARIEILVEDKPRS